MIIYCAVRNIDGEELPSRLSINSTEAGVQEYCKEVRRLSPEWDRRYPVTRIATFKCEEI